MVPFCVAAAPDDTGGWRRGKGWLGLEKGIYIHRHSTSPQILRVSWLKQEHPATSTYCIVHQLKKILNATVLVTLESASPPGQKFREHFNTFPSTFHDGHISVRKLHFILKFLSTAGGPNSKHPGLQSTLPHQHLQVLPPISSIMQTNSHNPLQACLWHPAQTHSSDTSWATSFCHPWLKYRSEERNHRIFLQMYLMVRIEKASLTNSAPKQSSSSQWVIPKHAVKQEPQRWWCGDGDQLSDSYWVKAVCTVALVKLLMNNPLYLHLAALKYPNFFF